MKPSGDSTAASDVSSKGAMKSVVLPLVIFAASGTGSFAYLRSVTPPSPTHWWVAAGAALSVLVAAWYARMIRRAKRKHRLLQDAASGQPPRDDVPGFFIGTIESRESVRAPFSAESVVAYRYSVVWARPSASGSTPSTYYSGSASVASILVTATGSYPLLCSPALVVESNLLERSTALANFQAHAASSSFERTLHIRSVSDLPAHRIDRKHWDGEPDWEKAHLEEVSVNSGDQVTVFAAYSRDRGGIVAHATEQPWLCLGGAAQCVNLIAEARGHGVSGTIFFLLVAIAIVGGYQFYVTQ